MSRKPWYYVTGRKDLTEQLIARKRERDAQRRERCAETANYFNRCSFQTKLHNQWNEERPIQRVCRSAGVERKAPFDMDYESMRDKSVLKNIETERNDAKKQLSFLFAEFIRCEKEAIAIKELGDLLLTKLVYVMQVNKNLKVKEEEWKLREKRFKYIRFGSDRLKHKGYFICEKLFYYKVLIENTFEASIYDLVTEAEKEELSAVLEGGKKIIEMYIDINYKRNTVFTTLYQEEAEKRWITQQQEWDRENKVWECLVSKIMDVYFTLLKSKLEENVSKQENSFAAKEKSFNLLSDFIDKIANNVYLRILLESSVDEYSSDPLH